MRVDIYYDGDCPVCRNFVLYSRLKQQYEVGLHNLREEPDAVREFSAMGYDVNEGMIVRHDGQIYFGGAAVHILSVLSRRDTLAGRIYLLLFSNARVTQAIYPTLRAGRNLLLRLLGRKKI